MWAKFSSSDPLFILSVESSGACIILNQTRPYYTNANDSRVNCSMQNYKCASTLEFTFYNTYRLLP